MQSASTTEAGIRINYNQHVINNPPLNVKMWLFLIDGCFLAGKVCNAVGLFGVKNVIPKLSTGVLIAQILANAQ